MNFSVGVMVLVIAVTSVFSDCFAQSSGEAKKHVEVPTIQPCAEDVATLDGIMKAFYDVISGPAGQARQWSRDRTLYIADIRFVAMSEDKSGHAKANIASHQQF